MISLWNLGTIALPLPKIPNLDVRIPQLEFLKHVIPTRGFKALYRSVVTDLAEVSRLGEIYDVISSRTVLEQEAREYFDKEEQAEFRGRESHWKIPM
jgi:hypothetical protein